MIQKILLNPAQRFDVEKIEIIEIIKEGGSKKTFEDSKDINKLLDFLKKIDYKRIHQDEINGWIYYIRIHYKNKSKTTSISFLQHRIKYNNSWHIGRKQYIDELDTLFKDFTAITY